MQHRDESKIRAWRDGTGLVLAVSDNGPGLRGKPVESLVEHVGVGNARARLMYLYGNQQTFAVDSPPTGGFIVADADSVPHESRAHTLLKWSARMTEVTLRVLVVDDEPPARRHIRHILSGRPTGLHHVGECGNGREALQLITTLTPDLMLLDIQMPELDGFGVLAQMDIERMPAVIFVTAYDEYALKAFDVHAIDYVLKPVVRGRLLLAIARAKEQLVDSRRPLIAERLHSLLGAVGSHTQLDRIAVRVDGKHIFLAPSSIDWVEAVDDYVRIHIGRTVHLVRGTLQSFEKQLPAQFLRIHRSAIIKTERVREVSSTPHGEYRLTLQDGTRLPSGRSYRGTVAEFLRSFIVANK